MEEKNLMETQIKHNNKVYRVDLSSPIDISIPLRASKDNVTAWYVDAPVIEPVKMGDWIGDVNKGGSVNFRNIFFNPHGHGTHTECVGHISKENYSINNCLKFFWFFAQLVTIEPEKSGNDNVITKNKIPFINSGVEALVIRTLLNDDSKISRHYSNTNPPYLHHEAAAMIRDTDINHLLLDLPSVDKEKDEGKMLAHKAFWNYPDKTRENATITELIYVPDTIPDGLYFLNIQIASFENDASPSKPVLYALK